MPHSQPQPLPLPLPLHATAANKRKRIESIVFSEKMRRKRMRQYFSTLSSMLPTPFNTKIAGYSLIDETVKYIEKLQQQLRDLNKKRELLSAQKYCDGLNSPWPFKDDVDVDVDVDVYGDEVLIRIASFKMPRNLWKLYQAIEARHLDIQSADVYRGDSIVLLSFHTANCTSDGSCTQVNIEQKRHYLRADLEKAYHGCQKCSNGGGDV